MALLHCEESFFFSSDAANGAKNKSPDGSLFNVQLYSPISIPKEAIYCTLEVTSATIWNVSPNIAESIGNNKFYFHTAGSDFNFTIPDGLYGVDELAARIQREIVELGLPPDLFVFSADASTQKVVIAYNYANSWIDFTQPDSIRDVLGFDARLVPLTGQPANHSETGDFTANFNRIQNYLLKSDIISDGISVNAVSDSIIADVLITSKPGSQIIYAPYHPPKANADQLIGHSKTNFNFRLTDQQGRRVDTLGESYAFTIVIRFVIKV
jgi:hypothetical protein